ncbi:MAG: glycosyltransferase [Candidatus Dojkabacteria bacterium]|jgi:glycosyltransferase involved in cell wall biosynthesis|nr:glycosyltransferase [Candidatus Dojkabacteria bacterium]
MMIKDRKTALLFENLFSWGGASVVNQKLFEIFPDADIFSLYGKQEFSDKYFNGKKVKFSFLNKFPFIDKLYPFSLPLWPIAIESFDFSDYDLVISSSHAVAKGCITPEDTLHISYVHSPMRFLWDMKDSYSRYGLLKASFLNYMRIWDVSSSDRPEKIITNSEFVSSRCKRYWGRTADAVIYPPVPQYQGELIRYEGRGEYFVAGAPFAENKGGEFLINCAKELKFNLKVIGKSRGFEKLKRLSRGYDNIEFVGKVSEQKKWELLSNSKGFLATGIEDFGIFPLEAVSSGTPVLALRNGGYLESIKEGINGVFYSSNKPSLFKGGLQKLKGKKWNVEEVSKSSNKYNEERFKREVEEYVRKSI